MPRTKVKALSVPRAAKLLRWYDAHGRDLPWRMKNGKPADPYAVWLSEIMLQQTTVTAVIPYFQKFMLKWPTVQRLAAADINAIRTAWAGLGYYRRAQNLHYCAQIIATDHAGVFPHDIISLKRLPGIGDYTAAAIAAIAFNQPANVVDGNVERIMARLHQINRPLKAAKPELRQLAALYLPRNRHGDYAQALMDLGATICTPKQPDCPHCPWQTACGAYQNQRATDFPVPAIKTAKPQRYATAFWLENQQGEIWLRQRPEKGLLGGMIEIPSSTWLETPPPNTPTTPIAACHADWQHLPIKISHSFTHFDLYIEIMYAKGRTKDKNGFWESERNLGRHALPSLMTKICTAVLAWRDQ